MTQYFSTDLSVTLTLIASTMWGSWMQVVKHRGDYPISGIVFLLYTFSLILVGVVTLILAPLLLTESVWSTTVNNIGIVGEIVLGGALMAGGLYFSLRVMSAAGLLLATTISGAVGSILGIAISLVKEGIPSRPYAVPLIILITAVFIFAGQICNLASQRRDQDLGNGKSTKAGTINVKIVLMAIVSAVLTTGWSIGTATGTASQFPPVLTCLYMAVGSFLCAFILCGISFTKNRQWKQILCLGGHSKKPLLLGSIAATCHYGGNLISIYSMPALSATLSFLFGRFSGLVTIAWGLFYDEFKGSSRRTKATLAAGILTYLLALALLGYYTYG